MPLYQKFLPLCSHIEHEGRAAPFDVGTQLVENSHEIRVRALRGVMKKVQPANACIFSECNRLLEGAVSPTFAPGVLAFGEHRIVKQNVGSLQELYDA